MKYLLVLVSFLVLLACKENDKKPNLSDSKIETDKISCVNEIFKRDSIFGEIRNHASEKISLSETITIYTKNIKSLDYSNCPEEFKSAFDKHIEAWLDFRKVSDKYPLLRGELHDIFTKIEKSEDSTEFKSRLGQILETWKLVDKSSNP
ncbi:hypothetical protein IMCC3317_21480 [Kordia antarctica]|uniref:Lipoprotein n=1 Tax=Kordia antarctica TaxID=1218801 RepID=A0A7L4ZJ77_9FLAO|nr:hypothetical protein [Kordia antarctica]QHI36778.1 hypothetical protein IMCC3317_21480 [Kordia antarctica]